MRLTGGPRRRARSSDRERKHSRCADDRARDADADHGDLLLALSAVLAGLMLVAAAWAMWAGVGMKGDAIDRAWTRLGERLARVGIARRENEGPLDLLRRTRECAPASAAALEPIVGEYIALRYGASTLAPQRVAAFAGAVRALRLQRRVNVKP